MMVQKQRKEVARSRLLEKAIEGLPFEETLIIDCHCHMGPSGDFWIPNSEPKDMIRIMDKVGVDVACVSHCLAIGPDYKIGNDLVSKALKEYPNRFVGFGVINPNYPDDAVPELERCFKELGMSAIKLHPGSHDYPINGPNYAPVFEYAEDRGLVIQSHTFGGAEILEKLSAKYSHVKFLEAHGCGWDGRKPNKIFDVVRERKNVFGIGSSSSIIYNAAIETIVQHVGADKVLYGSDFPYGDLRPQLGKIIYAKISNREKSKILGLNMAKILGINTSKGSSKGSS